LPGRALLLWPKINDVPGILGSRALKISGEIDFSKIFMLSYVTRQEWPSSTGSSAQFAANPEVSNAILRRKQVCPLDNLA
jgi:hypothetical protein